MGYRLIKSQEWLMRRQVRVAMRFRKLAICVLLIIGVCAFTYFPFWDKKLSQPQVAPQGPTQHSTPAESRWTGPGGFFNGTYIPPEESSVLLNHTRQTNENSLFYSVEKADTLFEQCKGLVNRMMETVEDWEPEDVDTSVRLTQTIERLRAYDRCFIRGDISLSEVLNADHSALSTLTHQLFPYMHVRYSKERPSMVTVYDFVSDTSEDILFHRTSGNVFLEWLQAGRGRGIVTTMAVDEVDYFQRLLRVLVKLKNRLPIQIIVTNTSDMVELRAQLKDVVRDSGQVVQILDASEVLNEPFVQRNVRGFLNKWIATMFNTFAEFIFIDADVVPFKQLNEFFADKAYRNQGLLVFRDRDIGHVKLESRCRTALYNLEPSERETELLGTHWEFNLSSTVARSSDFHLSKLAQNKKQHSANNDITRRGTEQEVYDMFFNQLMLHQVDSGLVVMRKDRTTYGSLLIAFQLNMAEELDECVHGDKEYFWLGPLVAGSSYAIDANRPGAVGATYTEVISSDTRGSESLKGTDKTRTGICSTQIGHYSTRGELLWLNGGAKICKNPNAAENDFRVYTDFMTERYNNVDNLAEIYNSPLVIDGVVVPAYNSTETGWMQTRECAQFRFCAYVDSSTDSVSRDDRNKDRSPALGSVIKFTQKQTEYYNELATIWAEDTDV
ncbi:hypothetical protein DAKH74_025940 [Maudiozyma humilis]|uniref:Alpha-1,3-mannosyltransferase n=1 Tax=Maudiozyma humilis TaxID=51915 RepID=A0AAV5RZE1_MAUHU|nr:hypothetical protein DAKH74_025940 [Kazachstania humilis]